MANLSSKKEVSDRGRKNREIFADSVNACFDSLSVNEKYTISKTNNKSIHPLVLTLSFKMYNFMKKIIEEIEASDLENNSSQNFQDPVNIKSEKIMTNVNEAESEASELDEENEERHNSRKLRSKPITTRSSGQSTSVRRQLDTSQSRHQPANVPKNTPVPHGNSKTNLGALSESEIKIESNVVLREAERLPSKSAKKRTCPPAIPVSAPINSSKRPKINEENENNPIENWDNENVDVELDKDEYFPRLRTKRIFVPYEEKLRIVNMARKHPNWSLKTLQQKSGCKFLRRRRQLETWQDQISNGGSREHQLNAINDWVFCRCVESKKNNEKISNLKIRRWGLEAKRTLMYTTINFSATGNWIWSFKKKHNIFGNAFDLNIGN